MNRLRAIATEAGFHNVSTFIASGNVIFDHHPRDDPSAILENALTEALGFDVPVFLRTGDEVVSIADLRPFGDDEGSLEISLLQTEPDPDAAALLVASATGDDRLAVVGREVYWSRLGPRSGSDHSESKVVRILGMATTQRSAATVRRIADRFLR